MPATKSRNAAASKTAARSSDAHQHDGHCCDHDHGPVCEMSIRRFKKEDFKGLQAAWKSGDIATDDTDSLRAIEKNLKERVNSYRVFVAEAQMLDAKSQRKQGESRVAGGVIVTFDGHRSFVYHLAVHVDFRGVGLGAALLKTCEQQAKLWGARHLRLSARVDDSRAPARAMYGENGWAVDKTIWIYRKTLPK